MTFGTMHSQLARHSLTQTRVAISKQSNYPIEETYSMLISEVTELLIRDHTSRTTPAGVSSRGALLLREADDVYLPGVQKNKNRASAPES
jgi:hypothetical protein